MTTTTKRLENFEILRSVSMLMIVLVHLYPKGMVPNTFCSSVGTVNYVISQYILVVCSVCVNCFVLISSYFLVSKEFNLRRILNLWIQTAFYSVCAAVLFFMFQPGEHTIREMITSLFPISTQAYWFITQYFGLVCLAPFLSKVVFALAKKQYVIFLLILVLVCCTFSAGFPLGDAMGARKGFTLLWFIALFFFGGYIRRFDPSDDSKAALVIFIASSILVFIFCVSKGFYRHYANGAVLELESVAYNGFAFLLSIPFFLWFKRKHFGKNLINRMLVATAPLTLGVYLIHDNPYLRGLRMDFSHTFDLTPLMNGVWFIPVMIVSCLAVYFLCSLMEYLRKKLFSFIRVDDLTEKFVNLFSGLVN